MEVIISEVRRNLRSVTTLFLPFVYGFFFYVVKDGFSYIESTIYATALFILLMNLSGFFSIYRDKNTEFTELVNTTYSEGLYFGAKLLSHLVLVCIYIIPFLVYCVYLYFTLPTDLIWGFGESANYILMYYFLPGCIGALMGMCVARVLPNKMGMILIFILSLLMSTLGIFVLSVVPGSYEFRWIPRLAEKINVGQFSERGEISLIYGFDVESVRFYYRLGYGLVLAFLFYLSLYIERRKKSFLRVCLILLILSVGFLYLSRDEVFVRKLGRFSPDAKGIQEINYYYEELKNLPSPNEQGKYDLLSFDADVDLRKALKLEGKMALRMTEDTDEIDFSLYHGFKLKGIGLHGEPLEFTQDSDLVNVKFPEEKKKGEELTLDISYKGLSSQHFFAGQRGTKLAPNFNWIPKSGKYFSFQASNETQFYVPMPLFEPYPVKYTLRVKSNYPVLSNLEKDEDSFEGISSAGAYLLSGRYIERQYRDLIYVYDPGEYEYRFPEEESMRANLESDHVSQIIKKAYELIGIEFHNRYTHYVGFRMGEELFVNKLPELTGIHDLFHNRYDNTITNSYFYFVEEENTVIVETLMNDIYYDINFRIRDDSVQTDLLFLLKALGRPHLISMSTSSIEQLTGPRKEVYEYFQSVEFEEGIRSIWRWYQELRQRELTYEEILIILQDKDS